MENEKAKIGLAGILGSSKRVTTLVENGLEFVVKYPSAFDRSRMGVERAKILDGVNIDSIDALSYNISTMIATLSVAVVSAPEGWSVTEVEDVDFLDRLNLKYWEWVGTFQKRDESSSNEGNSRPGSDEKAMDNHAGVQNSDK